jgi:membrane-bound lytic murein transglycosylase D
MDTIKSGARLFASILFCWLALSAAQTESQEAPLTESPFPILEGLEKSVEFWKQVFTVYDTSQLIFFDPVDPTNIYTVVKVENEKETRRVIKGEKGNILAKHGVDENRIKIQRGIKDRFVDGLVRSGRYIEQMQQIFREKGLPVELTYLPLVESSFNIHARSRAGAVGMWQFIGSTGRRFLRIDNSIDERKDPLESTRAAARLLKENHQLLGNWPLAVTAYNHGQEGLVRAIAKVGSRNLMELIRKYESRAWGFASKNFYAEFLAAVDVAKNVDRYFPGLEYHLPFPLEEIELKKATTISALLKSTGIRRKQLLEWNPALSSGIAVVPQGYRVKVPAGKPEPLLESANALQEPDLVRHRVRPGETLSDIARRYDASVEEIREINSLRHIHLIGAGQVLLIPKP